MIIKAAGGHIMFRAVRISLTGLIFTACVLTTSAVGQETPRAEKMRFNPDSGEWVEVPIPQPGTPAGDLASATVEFAAGRYSKSGKLIARWLNTYGEQDEHYPAALLLQARVEKAKRNYYVAYQLLDAFVAEFRGANATDDALVELFNVAEVFLSGVRRKVWGIRILKAKDLGLDILDDIVGEFPDTSVAELALKTKGDHHFHEGDFLLAELEYSRLLEMFPRSRYTRYALRRSADAALAGFGGVRFDAAPLIEADERYRLYLRQYPGAAEQEGIGLILQDIREKRAGKEFEIGRYYGRAGHPQPAAFYYRSTMENWPDTVAAARAEASAGMNSDPTIEIIESPSQPVVSQEDDR